MLSTISLSYKITRDLFSRPFIKFTLSINYHKKGIQIYVILSNYYYCIIIHIPTLFLTYAQPYTNINTYNHQKEYVCVCMCVKNKSLQFLVCVNLSTNINKK